MYHIMKALVQEGFDGPIRPDHGRTVWVSGYAWIWPV